jgi:hypothetical protein
MAAAEKLAGFAAVLLFAAAGAGWLQLLPGPRALPAGRRLALAYLLGVGWVGGALYALSHFGRVPVRLPAVLGASLVPAAAGLLAWIARRAGEGRVPRSSPPPARRRRSGLEKAAFAIAAAVFAGVLAEAVTNPLRDWDGRMTWVTQARYVRAEATVDARVLAEPQWYVTHPQYPLLMPVAQVAAQELAGVADDVHAFRPLYALFLPAFLALLCGLPRRRVSRKAAALTVLAASLLPFPTFFPGGGATSAYSDLPLACFYGAGLLLLLAAQPRLSDGVAAGLLLGAAVLSKNEGTPLALAVLALAAFAQGRRPAGRARRLVAVGAAGLGVALAAALLVSWRAGIPNRYDEDYARLFSLGALWPAAAARIPLLLPKIRFEMIALDHWNLFWSAAPVVLAAGWRGLRRRGAALLALGALAPLALAWIAYSLSAHPADLVRTTWNRFLVQASVPLLLLLSFALDDLLRRCPWLPRSLGGPSAKP